MIRPAGPAPETAASQEARGVNRRRFLAASLAPAVVGCRLSPSGSSPVTPAAPPAPPEWSAPLDRAMEDFMTARGFPGGALAVTRNQKLLFARGYGWADSATRQPVQPDSLFRIASVSKPITAVAVLKLVEQGRLKLDQPAFAILGLEPLPGARGEPDPRLATITVRQLLQHTGGWDRDASGDPMFRSREIARAAGRPPPADPTTIIRHQLTARLDFNPGTRYAYSNFGYCVLGRLIEHASGRPYGKFVQEQVLHPCGARTARLGRSLASEAFPGEVRYCTAREEWVANVFGGKEKVPVQYGGFCLEAMDAHGGWVASAVDLVRFASALEDDRRTTFLSPESRRELSAAPAAPVARGPGGALAETWYGLGWSIRPRQPGRFSRWHSGSLPGTTALLVARWDGFTYAALFNQRSHRDSLPDMAIDPALYRAVDAVKDWPDTDLFPNFA